MLGICFFRWSDDTLESWSGKEKRGAGVYRGGGVPYGRGTFSGVLHRSSGIYRKIRLLRRSRRGKSRQSTVGVLALSEAPRIMKKSNSLMSILRILLLSLAFLTASNIYAQLTKRADYSVVLPAGSKLDADDPDIDADHYTSITLPDGNTLTIVVVDEVASTDEVYKKLVADFEKNAGGKAEKTDLFAKISGEGVLIRGKANGMKIVMITGYVKGAKGFVFGSAYLETEKEKSLKLIRDTINSFKER
jgi:hypothetical protein